MFDILAQLMSSIATFVFPVFASYKALKANDPAQLTPWLMYWVVVACVLVVESWVGWFVSWFPFYQLIRACFMLYLVLPQTQGATKLYIEYIHPTLTKHEQEIEEFIQRMHEQAKAIGIMYIRRLIEMVKEAVFGSIQGAQTMGAEPPPQSPKGASEYASALFSRWSVAPLTPYAQQMGADFYTFLSSALREQAAGGAQGQGSTLIPSNITGTAEKARFIELQKQRLHTIMSALEKESESLRMTGDEIPDDPSGGLFKSPSQGNFSSHGGDFDHVSMDEAAAAAAQKASASGPWWGWGGKNAGTVNGGVAAAGKPHSE